MEFNLVDAEMTQSARYVWLARTRYRLVHMHASGMELAHRSLNCYFDGQTCC